MILATEETSLEEIVEMSETNQAQEGPNAEPEAMEQNPDEHREENPDEHREKDAQATEDNVGEQSDKEGQQQTPPVNLKYIV
ncbi:unnamed protein product [Lasius platythorax]|uniref:Uncharacterized protein n=2 Tax=Lasius TaxID=488720 RepID=A0A0J7K2E8_LASNI|nr:hypothetical protein RF55_17681 [Lasius niger]